MKKLQILDCYLMMKPTLQMLFEWPIIISVGLIGEIFSWTRIPFSPYSNFLGGIIFLGCGILHIYCHRVHKQAHDSAIKIKEIITTGLFSRIRHLMYSSLILMYLGVAITWGVVWMLIPSVLFSAITVLVAFKEEQFLLKKFENQYEEYKKKVPWRFLPGIY